MSTKLGAPHRVADNTPPADLRTIPANIQAETALLGSFLLDPDALGRLASAVRPGDFYRERNAWIYEAMLSLYERSEPIDFVLLAEELERMGRLAELGGPGYLTGLITDTPTAFYAAHYATIIREAAQRRRLIATAGKIAELAYDESRPLSEIMDAAEQAVFSANNDSVTAGLEHIGKGVQRVIEKVDRLSRDGGTMGIATGYKFLDSVLGGFQSSDLIILAARPGMGKSSLAWSFAANAAKVGKRVGVFSLEMSEEQSVERWLSMLSGIDTHRLRLGKVGADEWPLLLEKANELSSLPLYIDPQAANTLADIRARSRRLAGDAGLDLLIVDYMQLMGSAGNAENRHQEISKFSKGLKALAKELKVPVIALSQLSRGVESRSESGAIEEDADVVLFIYRDDYYHEDSDRQNIAEVIIAKHRHGATGTVALYFRKELTAFRDLEIQRTELEP
jgi:replicative DNA helicase